MPRYVDIHLRMSYTFSKAASSIRTIPADGVRYEEPLRYRQLGRIGYLEDIKNFLPLIRSILYIDEGQAFCAAQMFLVIWDDY
jgi:hypothetical protein